MQKLLQSLRRYGAFLLVLLVIAGVCLLFSHRKAGMFIDEIYTYGLSNSHYAPYLTDAAGGTLRDQTLTRQDLLDYVTVGDEGVDLASVVYNQVRDVHPPLYYWLFHLVSALTPHTFSKWTGLALDGLIYLWACLLLYRLVMTLFESRYNAAATVALYGLSTIGLSTMVMIRMYVLMTALTVLLALQVAQLVKKPRPALYPLIGLTIFLGLMTQYYFVFYAFFLCAGYVFWALIRKQYKSLGLFVLCAFAGVGLLVLCFPACLDQLFAEKLVSGGNALENLQNTASYSARFDHLIRPLRLKYLKAARYTALALLPLLLLCCRRVWRAGKEKRLHIAPTLLILLPAFVTLPLVIIISPVSMNRYFYNLIPILLLGVSLLLHLLEEALGEVRYAELGKNAAVLAILALALWEARTIPPDYLYPQYRDYDAALAPYASGPCVYMTDDYFAPVTQDLLQLLSFDDLFLTGEPESPALAAYLAERESGSCVVFIDVSEFWSSGFDPEEMLPRLLGSTEYTASELLYENELSATYVLTK